MNTNKNLFIYLEDTAFRKVWFGDNNQVDIVGKGSINFKANFGKIMHLHDTLYVLEMNHIILIIGQICLKDYMLVFWKKIYTITNETNK